MDKDRKLEILEAQERFRRRSALAGRLAESGIYLIGPLSAEAADLKERAQTGASAAQPSGAMIAEVDFSNNGRDAAMAIDPADSVLSDPPK